MHMSESYSQRCTRVVLSKLNDVQDCQLYTSIPDATHSKSMLESSDGVKQESLRRESFKRRASAVRSLGVCCRRPASSKPCSSSARLGSARLSSAQLSSAQLSSAQRLLQLPGVLVSDSADLRSNSSLYSVVETQAASAAACRASRAPPVSLALSELSCMLLQSSEEADDVKVEASATSNAPAPAQAATPAVPVKAQTPPSDTSSLAASGVKAEPAGSPAQRTRASKVPTHSTGCLRWLLLLCWRLQRGLSARRPCRARQQHLAKQTKPFSS